VKNRKIIVNIATSADGYVARPDGDLEWLTSRPAPKGFYGMGKFMQSVDDKVLGRKTYDVSLQLGAKFDRTHVCSRQPPPAHVPAGVEFVNADIRTFARRLRRQKGKNVWLMGGGEIGVPLIAPRHRHVALQLRSVSQFPDGVVQTHYTVKNNRHGR